ncbi:MAG: hypothetical protein R3Y36_00550 [Spirochaetales bacterium]
MENVIVAGIIIVILVLAVAYIVRAKKRGVKCIGCSSGKAATKSCSCCDSKKSSDKHCN